MASNRYLIVNADDFGLSPGVNRGIIEANEHGIVTSASLMVRWPAAKEAAAYSLQHQSLGLGLHIDLCEWTFEDETWVPLYEVVAQDDRAAVKEEVLRQLNTFRSLTGKNPTHLDSHQHVHLEEPVRSVMLSLAGELAVPLRGCSRAVHYCGSFYGQTEQGYPDPAGISLEGLLEVLRALPPGVTELGCHPGAANGLDTMYRAERELEVKVLCEPQVRSTLSDLGIRLCSFHQAGYLAAADGSPATQGHSTQTKDRRPEQGACE
jgi:predicted glycoside hydrolase/deacetylase ChbG (UPF0249 family)